MSGLVRWFGGALSDANISPSPEAFYIALLSSSRLTNPIDAINLNSERPGTVSDPCTKVVTYQGLLRVRGRVRFALVSSIDQSVVFDEVVVESPKVSGSYVFGDTQLVTLRALVDTCGLSVMNAVVRIENMVTATYPLAAGLANAAHVRTPTNEVVGSPFTWAPNALSVKAAGRFQLPLLETASGGDAAGMGWQSPSSLNASGDFQDGEVYMDASMKALLGRSDGAWYLFSQPERVGVNLGTTTWDGSKQKNLVFDNDASATVTLETDLTKVPRGSVVRVFNYNASLPSVITVKVGTTVLTTVGIGLMSEFLFYVTGTDGKWLVVQDSVATKRS